MAAPITVAVVLGAGGITGEAFHRGVLRALSDHSGFDARTADLLVGTSAGALVAAALRVPGEPMSHDFQAPEAAPDERRRGVLPDPGPLLSGLRRGKVPPLGVTLAALLPAGRRQTDWIVQGLRARHGDRWPRRPLWLVAVHRRTGRRVVFGRDELPSTDVATAVAASCAIPGYFQPVVVDGEEYVDGGVHSPTNADLLLGTAPTTVIVSSPMSVAPTVRGARLDLPPRLLYHRYLEREQALLRKAGAHVVAFEPTHEVLPVMGLHPLKAHRIAEIEDRSYRAACERLRSLGSTVVLPARRHETGGT